VSQLVEQLVNGLATGANYAIIAIGYNLIFGVLNVFNFAHGAVLMVGTYGVLLVVQGMGGGFVAGVAAGLLVAAATGFLLERLAVRPLGGNQWAVAVSTIGAAIFIENFVRRLTHARPEVFPRPFELRYLALPGGADVSTLQIALVVISIGLMLAMVAFLHRTRLGTAIRVIAQSPELARCVGIDVGRVVTLTFVLASLLGGAAGILNGLAYGSTYPYIGSYLGLKGFVVLIVAGVGNMRGALVIGLALGIAESMAVGFLGSTYRDFVAYGGLVLVLLARPSGLFGEEVRVV
jgi:branched-chain amino acid transport system permease protein